MSKKMKTAPGTRLATCNNPLLFGGCPECGSQGGLRQIGRDDWFYCEKHKTAWWAGTGNFSRPESTLEEYKANDEATIRFFNEGDYKKIEPVIKLSSLSSIIFLCYRA